MTTPPDQAFAVDLTNCDREPIHLLSAVQPFGFLISASADWLVTRVSENVSDFLDRSAASLLGRPMTEVFEAEALHALRNRMTSLRGPDAVERLFSVPLTGGPQLFDVALHFSGGSVVIEAEPAIPSELEAASLIRTMMGRLTSADGLTAFFREGARQVRALTDFDRVMVYRFDQTGSGEVVAEALRPGVDSFLGLHYPASDIPVQARALYLRNVFRIIADVDATPSPLTPTLDECGERLDQSMSVLRAVSPIHIEYLKNMGVKASLSISIIVDGKLWGLFACHHYSPLLPGFTQRSAAELFGQMFSMMLEGRERRAAAEFQAAGRALSDKLMASVASDGGQLTDAQWLGELLSGAIPADGVGISIEGRISLAGLTPDRQQFEAVLRLLNRTAASKVFATEQIAGLLPEATAHANRAAGMLAIPVSRSPRDYVVLFRAEQLRSVRWAGVQEKEIEYGPNGPRLTPRKSFEEWSELVRDRSAPFTEQELSAAENIRSALLEVVLRLSESAGDERRRAAEKQELLIAELNHRVRNILALIRGLVSQTRSSALSPEKLVETLEDRVQSLARAHDQITADRWGPARLIDLIEIEAGAYLGAKRERVTLEGPNVLIDPQAFTVLALVIHELLTNAAKYGALSDNGRVAIKWSIDADGSLLITWREAGGPAVQAPSRRGFGSTIIERSIPYDLQGKAEVRYRLTGLEADFCVPSRYVVKVLPPQTEPAPEGLRPAPANGLLTGKSVLLVEDSMIIALDGEDALRELGAAEVYTAATLGRALDILDHETIDYALLDFNLGSETSLPAGEALLARGTPFAFATGYGDSLDLPDGMGNVPVVKKPYNAAVLGAVIAGRLAN